jgi:DNA-binding NarL/FixJ family response regulator
MHKQLLFSTVVIGRSSLIREAITLLLPASHFHTLASAPFVEKLPAEFQHSQILFLIIHTGEDFDVVIQQIELLQAMQSKGRIAIIANHCQRDELVSAYRAGAKGYFAETTTRDVFIKSIELLMMGETIFPETFLTPALESKSSHRCVGEHSLTYSMGPGAASTPRLSPREALVLSHLTQGKSNKSIAREAGIAEATVRTHVKAILRKIRVQNRTQAAVWGMADNSDPVRSAFDSIEPSTTSPE